MGKRLRPKYVVHRCIICSKISHRFFEVIESDAPLPKVCLCTKHHASVDTIGWYLFSLKYDFAALYLASLGYAFTFSGEVYHESDGLDYKP